MLQHRLVQHGQAVAAGGGHTFQVPTEAGCVAARHTSRPPCGDACHFSWPPSQHQQMSSRRSAVW
jgi:hypothetical protein